MVDFEQNSNAKEGIIYYPSNCVAGGLRLNQTRGLRCTHNLLCLIFEDS